MTKLAEEITVKITLWHCNVEGGSTALGGNLDLRQLMFDHYWPKLAGFFAQKGSLGGMFKLHNDAIEIRWTDSKLQELPEESGGDN